MTELPESLRKAAKSEFNELMLHLKGVKAKNVKIDLDSLEVQAMISTVLSWKDKRIASWVEAARKELKEKIDEECKGTKSAVVVAYLFGFKKHINAVLGVEAGK